MVEDVATSRGVCRIPSSAIDQPRAAAYGSFWPCRNGGSCESGADGWAQPSRASLLWALVSFHGFRQEKLSLCLAQATSSVTRQHEVAPSPQDS